MTHVEQGTERGCMGWRRDIKIKLIKGSRPVEKKKKYNPTESK